MTTRPRAKTPPQAAASNRGRILRAATALFRRQGFHGTSIRDIADKAGVSLGNIYNHFPNKEKLFAAILAEFEREYFAPDQPLAKVFAEARFPENIEALGQAIRQGVDRFADYFRLIYVDMVEFDARHISHIYKDARQRYQRVQQAAGAKVAPDLDPVSAMMAVTFGYQNFFIMEKLFNAKGHYGMGEEEAIKFLGRIFRRGVEPVKS